MLNVSIEIEADREPIQGRLRAPGAVLEFTGWVQLIHLLERIRAAQGDRRDERD